MIKNQLFSYKPNGPGSDFRQLLQLIGGNEKVSDIINELF
jgi:hypothetical protein